jgi:hypothetical protein
MAQPLLESKFGVVLTREQRAQEVFTAVEEQLGLTLERNPRGSVEYVVITAAHAATED